MADGCVFTYKNIRFINLVSKDDDWLSQIRDIISPTRPLSKNRECAVLKFSSNKIYNWLVNNGCVPNKTKIITLPDVPNKYLPDFVRGYLDGDGSVSLCRYNKIKNGKTYNYPKLGCYICSISKNFIESLHKILTKNGIKNCMTHSISPLRGTVMWS